ncbi:tetratricopeptide repeat protein [Capnocytophaga gingivalis]
MKRILLLWSLFLGIAGYGQEDKIDIQTIMKKAKAGDAIAQYDLAGCYEVGEGVEKSTKEAIYWYKKSAEKGYSYAQWQLALFYKYGYYKKNISQSNKKAFYWLNKAATQNNTTAQRQLADFYYEGDGITQSYEKAFYWYERAAQAGDILATEELANLYEKGEGVAKSEEKAIYWRKKAEALITKQSEESHQRYTKAAEHGDIEAQCFLGREYYEK